MKFNGKALSEVISDISKNCCCRKTRTLTHNEDNGPQNLIYSSYDDVDGNDAEEMRSEMT